MTDNLPFDISVISKVLGIPYGKFYRWIKENISDFNNQETQKKLHQNDIPSKNGDISKTIKVPIFRQDQIGESMAIDEKHLNGRFYTVLTNSKTSKVAWFCSSIDPIDLRECFEKFEGLGEIKFITRDLSPTFKKVANTHFSNAVHIADKFHVIRHAIDAVQSLRISLKQQVLRLQRKEQSKHEQNCKESKDPNFIGPKMKIKKNIRLQELKMGRPCLNYFLGVDMCVLFTLKIGMNISAVGLIFYSNISLNLNRCMIAFLNLEIGIK